MQDITEIITRRLDAIVTEIRETDTKNPKMTELRIRMDELCTTMNEIRALKENETKEDNA